MNGNASLRFWTPVVYDHPQTIGQTLGNMVEEIFYLGGRRAHVISKSMNIVQIENDRFPLMKTVIKAALLAVIVFAFKKFAAFIPCSLLAAKILYRSAKKFKLEGEYRQEKTPKTVLERLDDIGKRLHQEGEITTSRVAKVKENNKKYLLSMTDDDDIRIQQIVGRLGRGGFGKVDELIDLRSNHQTALKVARPAKPDNPDQSYNPFELDDAENDLKNEFSNLLRLNPQSKVPGIQEAPLSKSVFTIVKQYPSRTKESKAYEGSKYNGNLNHLKVHQLPPRTRLDILLQIAKGLQYLHQQGFAHGDLKPANILWKKVGDAILAHISDFGGGRNKQNIRNSAAHTFAYTTEKDLSEIDHSLTKRGSLWSAQTLDVYSLGLTFYELLTGDDSYFFTSDEDEWRSIDRPMELIELKKELFDANFDRLKTGKFLKVLERMMKEEAEHMVKATLKKKLRMNHGRPGMGEVVKAVQDLLI